jgi:demethylmenaquinone methyltransferase/2-methoxy-6-polyprenyl-1,4-benzoquinol methylase
MAKKEVVQDIFNNIAPKYDLLNHLLSMNIDKGWRRKAMSCIGEQEKGCLLDVACGTGAMFEALRERKPSHITAVDLSEKMIEIAARKVEGDSLFELQCRDLFEMTQETFDRIIIYNAYPHFMEKDKVVQKVAELLNPGGRFIVAHGACKEKINGCHTNVPKEITSGLLSAKEESRLWETCFSIDILIDTEQFYMFSGVK